MPAGLENALIDWPETRTMQPHERAGLVESRFHPALRDRPEEVVRHVLLAAPDQLDRDAGKLLRDLHDLLDVILRAAAAPEAAAEVVAEHFALRERHAGGFGQRGERAFRILRADPCLPARSAETRAVQFIGSMVACARKGVA